MIDARGAARCAAPQGGLDITLRDRAQKRCRICGDRFEPVAAGREPSDPFCSERCRMADLAHWFEGDYRIAGPRVDSDESEGFDRSHDDGSGQASGGTHSG